LRTIYLSTHLLSYKPDLVYILCPISKRWTFLLSITYIYLITMMRILTALMVVFAVTLVQTAPVLEARGSRSGQGTFYDVGHGSCGTTNNDKQMVAAISALLMTGNSYCGKSILVKGKNGVSVSLKVVDTCPGCSEGDIDMSRAAFAKLAKLSDGRIPITWSFE
jgi:hypothetical protein